jgi:hypothetical protein
MLERIAKLIALAENASTVAEAEAAFAKAQELASRHSIDLEVARQAAAPKERETPIMRVVRIGEKGKRSNPVLINLFSSIGSANDVQILIAHNSTFVEAYGLPSDIDTVEALWASLAITMTRFADAHVKDKNAPWRSETYEEYNRYTWGYEVKKVTGQGARRSFCDGFTGRIGTRLRQARDTSIQEADRHFHDEAVAAGEIEGGSDNLPSSMALVLKDKRKEVDEFMDADYKRRWGNRKAGAWRGGRSSGTSSSSSRSAGRDAADRASLSSRRGIAS